MAQLNGYINVYLPTHPLATTNGMVYEHVIIAEKKIGRYLNKGEVVHHLDGNRSNNCIDNLLVFADKSDHSAFHQVLEYYLDESGIAHCDKNKYFCSICSEPVSRKGCKCPRCSKIAQRTVERPNREELKNLIRTSSFVQIGKQYNVSCNAIRKWCKLEGLPFRKRDIKTYSNTEWNNI